MHSRRLRMEPLEDRRLLATFTVSNLLDGPVTAAGQLPGSLRQAIFNANAFPGQDVISFGDTEGTIMLSAGELVVTEGAEIYGPGLSDLLTIDARQQSRIFRFQPNSGSSSSTALHLQGLTMTHGKSEVGVGGAVYSTSGGSLFIQHCTITFNSTTGSSGHGGAVYCSGDLHVTETIISSNSVTGSNSSGGGIYVEGNLGIGSSTIADNSSRGVGGGIRAFGTAEIYNSTLVNNSTSGPSAAGGGIHGFLDITIGGSTISGNHTSGQSAEGGGIFAIRDLEISYSTITGNHTTGSSAPGGGIAVLATSGTKVVEVTNSIIAGNTATAGGADFISLGSGTVAIDSSYSLLGTTAGLTGAQLASLNSGSGNLLNINPQLGPLQDNGGPTLTQALLPGSPAINAGDPAAAAGANGVPLFDQRGISFPRVSNGRIDIGAFEVRNIGDFDNDGDVDGRDFLAWQRNTSVGLLSNWQNDYSPLVTSADFDSDNDIDGRDFLVWQRGFGTQYDHDDLLAWQNQYGAVEDLAAIGSQLSAEEDWVPAFAGMTNEIAELKSENFGSGLFALSSSLARENASDVVEIIDDAATIEVAVDEAFAEIGAPSRSTIREFGDLVVRRLPSRLAFASDNSNDWLSTLDS